MPARLEAAVELRLREKCTCQAQDLARLAPLMIFSLERFDALSSAMVVPARWPVSRFCRRTQRRT